MSGGPTKTWIVGNSLVTITTSGKLTGDGKGTCKRCVLNEDPDSTSSPDDMALGTTCWHSGWAEIKIRRPSGNTGWMMNLQNRPHPLSLTHPSSLGIPESELGLLATTFSPEAGELLDSGEGGVAMDEEGVVKEKGQEVEEEYFFSTSEIGSFTDITFASRFLGGRSPKRGHVAEASSNVVGVGGSEAELAFSKPSLVPSEGLLVSPSKAGGIPDGRSELRAQDGEPFTEGKNESDTEGVDHGEVGRATKLNISEAAAIVCSDTQPDQSPQRDTELGEGITDSSAEQSSQSVAAGQSATEGVAPHVKRTANSQSWSEDVIVTSPVSITPRPSSYSFSMENLPPLLSYDGGEEFSHSPSLNEGGRVMSDEEQVN